jgi:hypothetical protein
MAYIKHTSIMSLAPASGSSYIDQVFLLVPAQQYVGQFLATFKEYSPRQKAASFTIGQAMEQLNTPAGK